MLCVIKSAFKYSGITFLKLQCLSIVLMGRESIVCYYQNNMATNTFSEVSR